MCGSHPLPLLRHVIDEEILAETIRAGVERATLVDPRHALDEGAEARTVVEHEGVDDDAPARDALDFSERLLSGPHADAAERKRPLAVGAAAEGVCGRLAGGNDDGVLVVAGVASEESGSEAEPVLGVGERDANVPAGRGNVQKRKLER